MVHHFLINPAAGKKFDTQKFEQSIIEACKSESVEFEIYHTGAPKDATEYVKNVLRNNPSLMHRFYSCGGDGTLGETVNGCAGHESAEFAVVPVGTGNDFCRNFTHTENFLDIRKQIRGCATKIDLLKINDIYSVNMINIGFDSDVVVEMSKLRRNRYIPNKLSYIAGLLIVLCRKLGFDAEITLDNGEVINKKLLLMAIANGSWCGGGFCSSPRASLNDGLLDSAIINKISRLTFIGLVPFYKNGTYLAKKAAQKCVDYRQLEKMSIKFNTPRNICIDGEIILDEKANISICRNAANISIPEGSSMINSCNEAKIECIAN